MMRAETAQNTARAESLLKDIREELRACMQCGTCSASCPNSHAMDLTPRRMWRMILCGLEDEVLESNTFYLCSSCYSCTLRCPRGLPLTSAMAALKRLAQLRGAPGAAAHTAFYRTFVDNIRRHGRVREADLMARYLLAAKNPGLAMRFAPLGLRMLGKGKVHPIGGQHVDCDLSALFDAAREREGLP
jgi:heterodisulfide reductase subunit C